MVATPSTTSASTTAAATRARALAEIGELIESGRFSLPVAQTFPLAEVAEAHRLSQDGQVRSKLVLLVGRDGAGEVDGRLPPRTGAGVPAAVV